MNDNLLSADNAVAGVDTATKSWGVWLTSATSPGAGVLEAVAGLLTADGAGTARGSINRIPPTSAGYRLILFQAFATTNGQWATPDMSASARHYVSVDYDRSATTNDPVWYVDGAVVAVTEIQTPIGTVSTGEDTLKCGENGAGSGDLNATIAHLAIHAGTRWTAAQHNRARWWGRPGGGLQVYHPFLTSKLADEGSAAETLTATGAVMGALVTPCVRPGSGMLGMGVVW